MHPLLDSLQELSDNELEQKIASASRTYWRTSNPQIQSQIAMVIDSYKQELENRRIKQRLEQQEKGDSDLDNLINIS